MEMDEIIPNLFLSTFHGMKENAKTHFIVNCTKDLPMYSDNGIRLAVDDNGTKEAMDTMFLNFDKVVDRIHQELENNNLVICHCLAAIQRSPTVIVAYLMKYHKYSLEDAITHIRSKKQDTFFWSVNFRDSLERYAMILRRK